MGKTKSELKIELRILKEGLRSINCKLIRVDAWEKHEQENDLKREEAMNKAQLFVDKYKMEETELNEFRNCLDSFMKSFDDYGLMGEYLEMFYLGFNVVKNQKKLK